jgi:hypothetical protein
MREIKLTQDKVALVDDEDFEYLNQWKWHAHKDGNNYYVERIIRLPRGLKYQYVSMHRLIMNTPKGMQTDHKDHDGLNNQKSNLRICTRSQNQMNRKAIEATSKYKGVWYENGKIRSAITINKEQVYLGYFNSEKDAAIAYDIAAKKYYGEFAYLNF